MVKAATYILENDNGIQELIGGKSHGNNHKVYPVVVPESEKAPYIVVRVVGRQHAGKGCDDSFQILVVSYANSYDNVTEINEEVISVLESSRGNFNGIDIGYFILSNESDDYVKEHSLYAKMTTFDVIGK